MDPIQPYLDEILGTERSILRMRCLQDACNALPPGDLTRLYLRLDDIGGADLCKLAPRYKYMTGWLRRRVAKVPQLQACAAKGTAQLYAGPQGERGDKTLYFLFSGEMGQFSLPLAVFIHLLPPGPKDVVVIRLDSWRLYREGVDGYGINPFEVATSLRREFDAGSYKSINVLGVSAGGIFALRVAEMLEADISIAFAGVYSGDALQLAVLAKIGVTAFDPICACRDQKAARLVNVLSSMNEVDCRSSTRLFKIRPKLIQYHLVNSDDHDVVRQMLEKGTAVPFFRMALADNAVWIRTVGAPFYAYGLFVRWIRTRIGVQKVQAWYAHFED